jgi:hypothetical protein
MHDITKLVVEFGTPGPPAVAHMAPDIIDGLRLIVQKLQPFIGDRIDFFPILFLGRDITHIFEILEGRIDDSRTRRVKAVEPFLQFPDDFVPIAGLVLEQIKDQVLELPSMKHPFLSPMSKEMFIKHGNLLVIFQAYNVIFRYILIYLYFIVKISLKWFSGNIKSGRFKF